MRESKGTIRQKAGWVQRRASVVSDQRSDQFIDKMEHLSRERRARLAAEHLLEQRGRELAALHARLEEQDLALAQENERSRQEEQARFAGLREAERARSRALAEVERAEQEARRMEHWLQALMERSGEGIAFFDARQRLVFANFHAQRLLSGGAVPHGLGLSELIRLAVLEGRLLPPQGGGALLTLEAWLAERSTLWREQMQSQEQLHLADGSPLDLTFLVLPDGALLVQLREAALEGVASALPLISAQDGVESGGDQPVTLTEGRRSKAAKNPAQLLQVAEGATRGGRGGAAQLLRAEPPLMPLMSLRSEAEPMLLEPHDELLLSLQDLLDYSRLEAEGLSAARAAFSPEQLLRELGLKMQPALLGRGVEVLLEVDMELPDQMLGDAARLEAVLMALLQHMVWGVQRGHVLIRLLAGAEGHLHLTLEVSDSPLTSNELAAVMAELSPSGQAERVISHHGGAVWAECDGGGGLSIGMRLSLPPVESGQAPPQCPPLNVLLLEERFLPRMILQRQLSKMGANVSAKRSLIEAVNALKSGEEFDLILVSDRKGGGEPLSLLQRARSMGSEARLALISAEAEDLSLSDRSVDYLPRLYDRAGLRSLLTDAPEAAAPPSVGRMLRLAVAGGSRTERLKLRRMLKGLPVDLVVASKGRDLLRICASFSPDLVLLHLDLPDIDLRNLLAQWRSTPVAEVATLPLVGLCSGEQERLNEAGLLAAGLDLVLQAPLQLNELSALLSRFAPPQAGVLLNPRSQAAPLNPSQSLDTMQGVMKGRAGKGATRASPVLTLEDCLSPSAGGARQNAGRVA